MAVTLGILAGVSAVSTGIGISSNSRINSLSRELYKINQEPPSTVSKIDNLTQFKVNLKISKAFSFIAVLMAVVMVGTCFCIEGATIGIPEIAVTGVVAGLGALIRGTSEIYYYLMNRDG